jgi:hypothetical protein
VPVADIAPTGSVPARTIPPLIVCCAWQGATKKAARPVTANILKHLFMLFLS